MATVFKNPAPPGAVRRAGAFDILQIARPSPLVAAWEFGPDGRLTWRWRRRVASSSS